ncbi:helix-turn-helix domain-containing protein [Qaidamihabitans albus]|uniref:helix-turn-helix domain-containing protein n=1 Tax=Qaidamihabitans albus TaxID=2795733 RepID=UPI0018F1A0F4|nr:helix-turn-helix domain-containing protein [Qaidamihabitans albus]
MAGQSGAAHTAHDSWQYAEQLQRMHGDAARTDGLRLVLRRLARAVDGRAALLDETGRLEYAFPGVPAGLLAAAEGDLARLREGRARSASVRHGTLTVSAMAIGDGRGAPVLLVAADEPRLREANRLVADAGRLLWLCWQVETARRGRQRVDSADSAIREAVLHLLMLGEQDAARRVAAALGPRLPAAMRVYVVESGGPRRDAVAARLAEVTGGRAWIVRCPVYTGHVIVLAPDSGEDGAVRDRLRELAGEPGGPRAGASLPVALRNARTAYEQAFHALARARAGPTHFAVFSARYDLAAVLGAAGTRWAARLLAPLHDHVPARPQDPGAAELVSTLDSWLSFHRRAAAQLKIHRNTLSARLARIEEILGCDVHDVGTQARLHLALRLLEGAAPRRPEPADDELDTLIIPAVAGGWAENQLAPLLDGDARLADTVRAWLGNNARLDATATALGVSTAAVRKRLTRAEALLERALLYGPSARYDLYLALRVHDAATAP